MSIQELHYIVEKAEAFRGEEGERMKIAVFDYIWEEEDVSVYFWEHVVFFLEKADAFCWDKLV